MDFFGQSPINTIFVFREQVEGGFMETNAEAMVMASFVADSLALGAHWIYDIERISESLGRVDSFLEPASNSYHSTKGKGEFTHYGDQAFILLESLV